MHTELKLSVALCTYNGEKYLKKQLQSIFSQTFPIDEIIVTDDQSTDNTITILNKFKQQFPNIITVEINKEKLGAKQNFEKAISKCTGDVIFLSDQDDIWYNNKVEKIVTRFTESPYLEAIFSDADLIDDHDSLLNKTLFHSYFFDEAHQESWKTGNAIVDFSRGMNKITGATLAIKRELFQRSRPFNLPYGVWHDAWLGLNAAIFDKLDWLNDPLIKYRIHKDQQVGVVHWKMDKNEFHNSRRETMLKYSKDEKLWLDFTKRIIQKYPVDTNQAIRTLEVQYKKQLTLVNLLDFRLSLPVNIIKRFYKVINNLDKYYKVLQKPIPIRTILNDILNKM